MSFDKPFVETNLLATDPAFENRTVSFIDSLTELNDYLTDETDSLTDLRDICSLGVGGSIYAVLGSFRDVHGLFSARELANTFLVQNN